MSAPVIETHATHIVGGVTYSVRFATAPKLQDSRKITVPDVANLQIADLYKCSNKPDGGSAAKNVTAFRS